MPKDKGKFHEAKEASEVSEIMERLKQLNKSQRAKVWQYIQRLKNEPVIRE